MGGRRDAYRILVGEIEGMRLLEDPGVDGRIIKWSFKKRDGEAWTGKMWIRIGTGGRRFVCGDEPSGSINCEEFLD
jgi:hypothetical protein